VTRWDGDGGTAPNGLDQWHINGANAGASDRAALNTGDGEIQVGSRLAPFIEGFTGNLTEVLMYDRELNEAERIIVENHLSAKYNIGIASDHYFGDTADGEYDYDVIGIGREDGSNLVNAAGGAGLGIQVDAGAALDDGDYVLAGHDSPANGLVDLPGEGQRWQRVWYVDETGGVDVVLHFDFSAAGLPLPAATDQFVLLYSDSEGGAFVDLGITASVDVDSVTFVVSDATLQDGYYTLGIVPEVVADGPRVVSVVRNAGMVDPPDRPGAGPQPTSWDQQQAELYNIQITFDQPVTADENDFVLTNLGINAPVDADTVITLTPAHVVVNGNTVTLDFGGLNAASRQLPSGVYRLEILPTVTNQSGTALDGDGDGSPGGSYLITGDDAENMGGNGLARLDAEWNGDLQVSIFDFAVLVYWFNATPFPEYMDVNRDGGVTIFDFQRMAAAFIQQLVFPTPLAGSLDLPTADDRLVQPGDDAALNDQVVIQRAIVDSPPLTVYKHRSGQLWEGLDADEEQESLLDLLADDMAHMRARG
jgi:hypothetical protein